MKIKFWNGRWWFAVSPRRLEPWTAVGSVVTGGRVAAASVGLEPPRRRAPAWRPVVAHAVPRSTPRPRERGARMVAASGRDGTGDRDDGSGDSGDGAGGGGDGPPGPAPASDDPGGAL